MPWNTALDPNTAPSPSAPQQNLPAEPPGPSAAQQTEQLHPSSLHFTDLTTVSSKGQEEVFHGLWSRAGRERSPFLLRQKQSSSIPLGRSVPPGPQHTQASRCLPRLEMSLLCSTKEQLGTEQPGGEQSGTRKPRCPGGYVPAAPGRCSCRRGAWLGNSGAATPRSPWQTATAGRPYCHSNASSESGRDPPTNVR